MAAYMISLRNRSLTGTPSAAELTPIESLENYDLGGVDCEQCGNTGMISYIRESGELISHPCPCMQKRIAKKRIRQSGLEDAIRRYRFDTYRTETEEQKNLLKKAMEFAEADTGWFYIYGQPGSGKSHLCTAICGTLIERNIDTYYLSWRDQSTILKSLVTDPAAYEERMKKLKTVPVLYCDDFLKLAETEADLKLAFELINGRYINTKLRTILSSEITPQQMFQRDEALLSRITERAQGYILKAPNQNLRFQTR